MFPEFSDFNIEITNKEYIREDGLHFPKTAILTFIAPDGHFEIKKLLGYASFDYISERISNGLDLDLNDCYIDHFSLLTYRQQKNIDKKSVIKIKSLTAANCFFNNKLPVDLSFTEFLSGRVSFGSSYFVKNVITMHGSKILGGGLDFSNAFLPSGNIDFTNLYVADEIDFKNAVFGPGTKDFQDAEFGNGDVIFTNTEFNDGDASFVNTRFGSGNISFKVARFGKGKVDFHYAKIGAGDISFERTEFGEGRVDFRTVEFGNGRVNFNRAVFGNGEVSFEASQLKEGKMSFKKTTFGEGLITFELAEYDDVELSFDRADFGKGIISFYNARINILSLRSCHLDHYTDLRFAKCSYIDLSDTVVRDIVDFKPYDFDVDIDMISFAGMRLIGRIFIDWEKNNVKKIIMSQRDSSKRIKAEQFRTLKQNFNVTGQYNDEDKSYVEFKRLESKAILEESLKKRPYSAIWMYPLYAFKLVVFDLAGLYATNPFRVMISMLTCYSFFSLVAAFLAAVTNADIVCSYGNTNLGLVASSFYYTIITFLTIGYGDFYPTGILHVYAGVVGFTGLFLMSYFTVAFVRKVLR